MAAPGSTSLPHLLRTISPVLDPRTFVFITLPAAAPLDTNLDTLLLFHEPEGTALITTLASAIDAGLINSIPFAADSLAKCDAPRASEYEAGLSTGKWGSTTAFLCKMIRLDVQSSLDAVGFMAVVTGKLAQAGVSCNPVSAFWHDYLFVPSGKEGLALEVLESIRTGAA